MFNAPPPRLVDSVHKTAAVYHFFLRHTLDRRRKTALCFYIRQGSETSPSERASSLCGIASSLIVPSPLPSLGSPSERYLFANSTPSTRTASLPPSPLPIPNVSFFGFFRSIVPSFPPPLVRAPPSEESASPPIPSNYMLIHSLPPSKSGLPHPSRGPTSSSHPYVSFILIRARAYHYSQHLLASHPGTLSLRPPMARQLPIIPLTHPPPGPASYPSVGRALLPLISQ